MPRPEKVDDRAERLAAYVKAVVDQAPPLTPEQRDKLRVLLEIRPTDGEVKRSKPIELEIER